MFPTEWFAELFGNDAQIETKLERMTAHTAETLGECLGVAVRAAGANLGASTNGIPSCVSPLDF